MTPKVLKSYKCKVMHVGKNNPCYEYRYSMRGVKISKTEEDRDVGVIISKNLKPSAQCTKAAGRASGVLQQIRRNFHSSDFTNSMLGHILNSLLRHGHLG